VLISKVQLGLAFFFISRFLFLPLDLLFICRFAFASSFSFVILRYVVLRPRFLLSSELFVNARWTILSPSIAKLTTKKIASDQKSSSTLWQSERISGWPRTAVKVGP
jgi:predicted branched-subunit amino acid permease